MPHRRVTSLALLAAVSIAALALPACSVVEEVAYQRHASTFDDAGALRDAGGLDPAWIPADATSLQVLESTRDGAADASVLLDSDAELDSAICAPVDRQSAPSLGIEGAPDVYAIDSAYACGEWTVTATDSGWYGWTPGHPDEAAQSPAT